MKRLNNCKEIQVDIEKDTKTTAICSILIHWSSPFGVVQKPMGPTSGLVDHMGPPSKATVGPM